jgi:hypothetical protein
VDEVREREGERGREGDGEMGRWGKGDREETESNPTFKVLL